MLPWFPRPNQEKDSPPTPYPVNDTMDDQQPLTGLALSPKPAYHTIAGLQQNRSPSSAPTYHTVDDHQQGPNRASSPTPTYYTMDDQQRNNPLNPTLTEDVYRIKAQDRYGKAVLHQATGERHEKRGRQPPKKGSYVSGHKALFWVAAMGQTAAMRLLIERGADIEGVDKEGCTALHHAAQRGQEEVTRLLLKYGADVKVKDKGGRTPLCLALANRKIAAARLLLEKEDQTAVVILQNSEFDIATQNFQDDIFKARALNWAAKQSYIGVARLLLDAGVDVAGKYSGYTALHEAARMGNKP
jgi:ankyrin repeat protein